MFWINVYKISRKPRGFVEKHPPKPSPRQFVARFGPFDTREDAQFYLPTVVMQYSAAHYRHFIEEEIADSPSAEENPDIPTFRVIKRDSDYWIKGLPDGRRPDTFLIVVYDEGDADRPYNAELMLRALYDIWQVHDSFQGLDGAIFETPFGTFVAEGVHVRPA